jgi:hypothetical protein
LSTIWTLVKKDLLRDSRHPWGLVVFMIIPVLTAAIVSLVFSPRADIHKSVTIRVAVLDRDDDLLSRLLRSGAGQGQTAENLQLDFVDSEQEGIEMVERREVSAFVILPENLTVDLLDGRANRLTLYKNPAQAILPKIVEEGLLVVCIGVSQGLHLLQPQIKAIRDIMERDELAAELEVASLASSSMERLRAVEPYLFPPLVQFQTIDASEYVLSTEVEKSRMEEPGL